jgi:hypothetical protein
MKAINAKEALSDWLTGHEVPFERMWRQAPDLYKKLRDEAVAEQQAAKSAKEDRTAQEAAVRAAHPPRFCKIEGHWCVYGHITDVKVGTIEVAKKDGTTTKFTITKIAPSHRPDFVIGMKD